MLSPAAEKLIEKYFNLPFPGVDGVRCPYYINRRGARAQLRVLSGKGSPEEIVEESKIISIQYQLGLFEEIGEYGTAKAELLRKFLIEQNIGIECSGFVSHILKAHYLESLGINITKKLSICPKGKLVRTLICKLRPIENMDVRVYADDRNSQIINIKKDGYKNIKPGDYIVMLETGPLQKRNHIILINEVDNKSLGYVHARAWSSEGKCGHGVTKGKINITNENADIEDQEWVEKDKFGAENETWNVEIKQAKKVEIRRLKI